MKDLTRVLESWFKVFLTSVITLIVAAGSVRNVDWWNILDASFISFLPAVINYLNPNYNRYGSNKKKPNES